MSTILGYENKNVVVTGAASGMGQAAAEKLSELGANVYALDIAPISLGVTKAITVDMKDASSIDAALTELPEQIDSLFNCAGVPSPPFSAKDTILINFVGLRYFTDRLIERMPEGGSIACIASTAGMGWKPKLEKIKSYLSLDNSFETASQWIDDNTDVTADGYGFSKQAMIVYVMTQAKILAGRNIRINAISPSPTDSGFMKKLKGEGEMPDEAIDLFLPSNGRYATGAEMGDPLIMLNSNMMSFVSGVNLPVDYGYCAEVILGDRDDLLGIA